MTQPPRYVLGTTIAVWLCVVTGTAFATNVPFSAVNPIDGSFYQVISMIAADVDGDGDIDVLAASPALDDSRVDWWENTAGDGSAWAQHTIDSTFDGPGSLFAADIDGDGDVDVFGASHITDEIAWWENTARNGSTWTRHIVADAFDSPHAVFAADVDGDGDLDVLAAAALASGVAWWENADGDGSNWNKHTLTELAASPVAFSLSAADFDGDGDTDVMGTVHSPLENQLIWWENAAGDGITWTEHLVDDALGSSVSRFFAADMDGDGDIDGVAASSGNGEVDWWENTAGDGSAWTKHAVAGAFNGVTSLFAADIDSDGDVDLLGAKSFSDDIVWWEGTAGDGSAWTEHTIDGEFNEASSIFATDIDGDGDLDVLGAARQAGVIAWWENGGRSPDESNEFDIVKYFPLTAGNRWTYVDDDLLEVTSTVLTGTVSVNGAATKVIQDSNGDAQYFSNDDNGLLLHRVDIKDEVTNVIDKITFAPPLKLLNPTATVGPIITSRGTASLNFPELGVFANPYSANAKVVAAEIVEVPAGVFSAIKVELNLTISGALPNGFPFSFIQSDKIWLVRHLGTVKQTTVLVSEGNLGSTVELTSFLVDDDSDGVNVTVDNCPTVANPLQLDTDDDDLGNACDPDDDNDGLSDEEESGLGTDPLNPDSDGDGVSDGDEFTSNRNPLFNEGAVIQIINSILLSDE